MSDQKEEISRTLTDKEQQRISECFTKTIDHYGSIPKECAKCPDSSVCVALETGLDKFEPEEVE